MSATHSLTATAEMAVPFVRLDFAADHLGHPTTHGGLD